MILEFSKLNTILYFLVGSVSTFAMGKTFFGILILFLSFCLTTHKTLVSLNVPILIKYQNVTKIPCYGSLGLLILIGLYVLNESNVEMFQKGVSIAFLLASIVFYYVKIFFKGKYDIFNSSFVNEIPSLFFMVYLFIIISFPDNQSIMNAKYIEIKEKLGIKENKYEF